MKRRTAFIQTRTVTSWEHTAYIPFSADTLCVPVGFHLWS